MSDKLQGRFIGLYVFLGLVAACSFFATYKGLQYRTPPKHPVTQAQLKDALGETDLVKTACSYVTQQASAAGVILSSCKQVHVEVKGNAAVVTLKAISTDATHYTIAVYLNKGVWQASSLKLTG